MLVTNYAPLNNVDVSVNQTSAPISLLNVFNYSIQNVFTGSPMGSIKLQASNDPNTAPMPGNPAPPTHWTDISNTVTSVSGAMSFFWEDQASTYAWIRIVYTASSGTGNLTSRINTRGV